MKKNREDIKMSTKITTGKVRLSYANIWEPKAFGNGDPKFSCALLIPKSDKVTLQKIAAAITEAKAQGIEKIKKFPTGKCDVTLYDGDGEKPKGGDYGEEAKGCYVLNCNSKQAPGVVDLGCNAILNKSEVYSGCYVRASVNFYPYDFNGNKGIGCGLQNIQKISDGEPFGGRSNPDEDFADSYEGDFGDSSVDGIL